MPIFITLLIPKSKGAEAVEYVKKLKPPKNIKILNCFFTLGRYDGVIIYEAPDAGAAMSFAASIGFATGWTVETLVAAPVEELKL